MNTRMLLALGGDKWWNGENEVFCSELESGTTGLVQDMAFVGIYENKRLHDYVRVSLVYCLRFVGRVS